MVAVKMRRNKKHEQQKTDETSAESGAEAGCETSVVKETSDDAEKTAGGEKKESLEEERRELVAEPDRQDKETNRDN